MRWLFVAGSAGFAGVTWSLVYGALSSGRMVGKHGTVTSSNSPFFWLMVPLLIALAVMFTWATIDEALKAIKDRRPREEDEREPWPPK